MLSADWLEPKAGRDAEPSRRGAVAWETRLIHHPASGAVQKQLLPRSAICPPCPITSVTSDSLSEDNGPGDSECM